MSDEVFTTAQVKAATGWIDIRARKVLERLEVAGLLTSELVYTYVTSNRPATERRKACIVKTRLKVKHYRIAEHAFEKMAETEREAVGTEYAGKPRRIISSVFDLGLHA
jgi:hypothetical protein